MMKRVIFSWSEYESCHKIKENGEALWFMIYSWIDYDYDYDYELCLLRLGLWFYVEINRL